MMDDVAEGVVRLGTMWAHFYLVVEDDEATLIDAGYPRYSRQLDHALRELQVRLSAVVVTHHHVYHTGTAEHAQTTYGTTVYAHPDDRAKVEGEQASHPPDGFYRQAWRLTMLRYLAHTVAVGGARYHPVTATHPLTDGQELDAPGRPRIVHTPGHTRGHCSVLVADRGVLFTGDALVNFDYASGAKGLRLHRFNEDRSAAAHALGQLAGLDANVLVFGHGDPWKGAPRDAAERAHATA